MKEAVLTDKNQKSAYVHFMQRLAERYNLFITIEEWRELNQKPYIAIFKISQEKKVVLTSFKDTVILAVKGNSGKNKKLLTALPIQCRHFYLFKQEMEQVYFDKVINERQKEKTERHKFIKAATGFSL